MNDRGNLKTWVLKIINPPKIDFGDARVFASSSFEERYNSYVKYVLSFAQREGIWLEFGVSTGETTKKYVEFMDKFQKPLYGFDSFFGLPEKWAKHGPGKFSTNGQIPKIDGAEMIVGLFEDTLPGFVQDKISNISVLIVDCDLYSSTKTIFNYVKDYLIEGTIIIFDEIHNGSGIYKQWMEHEYKALNELIIEKKFNYKWIAYEKLGEQAALMIIK
jgi:hypothetical protein